LARLVAARPPAAPRERRRLLALRAEALDQSGDASGAAALREEILREARRDDAAAIVLAREMRGRDARSLPDRLLPLLIETAKEQRDLDLAERLATERDAGESRGYGTLRARLSLGRRRRAPGRPLRPRPDPRLARAVRGGLDGVPVHPRRAAAPPPARPRKEGRRPRHRRLLRPRALQRRHHAREARAARRGGRGAAARG